MTNYEVVIAIFRNEDENRGVSLAQKSLFFNDIKEVVKWCDDSGVVFK
jgi:hypothetical protein